ncbi:hypothetical protein EYF80_060067 [Liparis tanakae]|uniref:Uncharacterized protein n=1 Tax=Liparis tanakae TaxID=230148 RepID=A0A4Z2ELZ0_9TELE|nr:hypothetical protein EYF80_060067 [Liparis tanakae]
MAHRQPAHSHDKHKGFWFSEAAPVRIFLEESSCDVIASLARQLPRCTPGSFQAVGAKPGSFYFCINWRNKAGVEPRWPGSVAAL